MSDDNGSSKLAFFLAGMGIGAILALLFAPKSGEETRRYLAEKAEEGKGYLESRGKQVRDQAEEMGEKVKESVAKAKERLSAAYEAGVKKWEEEKAKTS